MGASGERIRRNTQGERQPNQMATSSIHKYYDERASRLKAAKNDIWLQCLPVVQRMLDAKGR